MNPQTILVGIVFGAFLIFAPYITFPGISLYDSKRILQIGSLLILSFGLLFLLKKKGTHRLFVSRKVIIPILLIFTFGGLSASLAIIPSAAWIEVLLFFGLASMVVLLGYQGSQDLKKFKNLLLAIAVGYVAVYSIYFTGNYISAHLSPMVPFWPDRIGYDVQVGAATFKAKEVLNFVFRRFFNHTQTWTIPLLTGLLVYLRDKKIYYSLLFLLLSIWWVLVFASGARGTAVAVIIAIAFIFLKYRETAKLYGKNLLYSALSGILVYIVLYYLILPVDNAGVSLMRTSSSGRMDMWLSAFQMFIDNPVLGVGPYHYAFIETTPTYAHPHNFYLQVLAEWGVISFLALAILLFFFVKWLYKDFDRENFSSLDTDNDRYLRMGLCGSILAALIHAGVSGIFHTPMSQMWFILVGAYFVAYYIVNSDSAGKISIKGKSFLYTLKSILITVILLLTFFTVHDAKDLNENSSKYIKKFNTNEFYPRFWGQGLIYQETKTDNAKQIGEAIR